MLQEMCKSDYILPLIVENHHRFIIRVLNLVRQWNKKTYVCFSLIGFDSIFFFAFFFHKKDKENKQKHKN